ncbi:hypothetical protein [Streptomyces sp. NPDC046925]|uniref:hypothetical protein n=1 Tax=Streptomyces sp. NPDC046925 TaxID=3155375 RepID=UPI0033F85A8D
MTRRVQLTKTRRARKRDADDVPDPQEVERPARASRRARAVSDSAAAWLRRTKEQG